MGKFKVGDRVTVRHLDLEVPEDAIGRSGVVLQIADKNGIFGWKYEGWVAVDFQEELFWTHNYGDIVGGRDSVYLFPASSLSNETDDVREILELYKDRKQVSK